MTLDKYLENRRSWELAIGIGLVLLSFFANLSVVWMEFARRPGGFDAWEPWVLEGTSHLGLAIIIPIVIWFDRQFPIRVRTWRTSLPAHALFSVVASLLHVTIRSASSQRRPRPRPRRLESRCHLTLRVCGKDSSATGRSTATS